MSLNVHGLRNYSKSSKLFSRFLFRDTSFPKPDVVFFQETHCTDDFEHTLLVCTNLDLCFANKTFKVGG